MNLGSSFDFKQKLESFQRQFLPGRILYLFCDFTTPPKEKFLVVGCVTPKPLFLIVNCRISNFIYKRPHLLHGQVRIDGESYGCFQHECFVECTTAIDSFTVQQVIEQVINEMARIKEMISDSDRYAILDAVKNADTLIEKHKKWLLDGLDTDLE